MAHDDPESRQSFHARHPNVVAAHHLDDAGTHDAQDVSCQQNNQRQDWQHDIWQQFPQRCIRVDGAIATFHATWLIVVDAEQVDFALGD